MMVELRRRKFLAAIGIGGLATTAGVGYAGAQRTARKGLIQLRIMTGNHLNDNGAVSRGERLFTEEMEPDGPPKRQFNPDYRQYFPENPPITVSQSAHKALQQKFDIIDYAVSHRCPDADCSTPPVSREDFNSLRVGDEVSLLYKEDVPVLYNGAGAVLVPPPPDI
jgi:hypothetical protein